MSRRLKFLKACAAMVDVFREVRRVLSDDGTVWINLGDSYAGSGPSGASYQSTTTKAREGKSTDGAFRISKTLADRGLSYAEKKPIGHNILDGGVCWSGQAGFLSLQLCTFLGLALLLTVWVLHVGAVVATQQRSVVVHLSGGVVKHQVPNHYLPFGIREGSRPESTSVSGAMFASELVPVVHVSDQPHLHRVWTVQLDTVHLDPINTFLRDREDHRAKFGSLVRDQERWRQRGLIQCGPVGGLAVLREYEPYRAPENVSGCSAAILDTNGHPDASWFMETKRSPVGYVHVRPFNQPGVVDLSQVLPEIEPSHDQQGERQPRDWVIQAIDKFLPAGLVGLCWWWFVWSLRHVVDRDWWGFAAHGIGSLVALRLSLALCWSGWLWLVR